jgi:dienelactone hydrolase
MTRITHWFAALTGSEALRFWIRQVKTRALAIVLRTQIAAACIVVGGAALRADDLADALAALSPEVLTEGERKSAAAMVARDLRRRRDAANAKNRSEWATIGSREQWESYRDERLRRLRDALGSWPKPLGPARSKITGTIEGEGFVIEKLVFETRPDDWVSGNLYRPEQPRASMPGITITHAHHQGKEQGELQDMGMTWARAGCVVLIIDQVGYGERRAHPFRGPADYAKEYRHGRQDYYHRYDSGVQLHLIGESLMGWMVWDQMRGVDLLLSRKGVDPGRIIMLGAVAGGGDPCGITAALDPRIAAAVPFNFGGPQPETQFPLPGDAETSFNYLMGSYWESTRGLRRTAADGFFHWLIAGSIAPRRLIHAHEFSWDRERDPVWNRYEKIYGEFYGAPDHLAFAHGKGLLSGNPPEASHCGQIGHFHRRLIHPAFQRWFEIKVTEEDEFSKRRDRSELMCLTQEARRELQPAGFGQVVSGLAAQRLAMFRQELVDLNPSQRRERLRAQWAKLLGEIDAKAPPAERSSRVDAPGIVGLSVRRVVLKTEPDIVVPLLLISAVPIPKSPLIVLAVAQSGKAGFLENRPALLAELIRGGAAVCLPDLRGTGETNSGSSRGRTSGDTDRSVNVQLHDQTMLGQRLRDLRSVLRWLRARAKVDGARISLWGDSFAPINAPGTDFKIPHGVEGRPSGPEPLGGLLALFAALFDEDIERIYLNGGLVSYRSVLAKPHVFIPHDVVVPGALTAGDLSDIAGALAPLPLRCGSLVDGFNRRVSQDRTLDEYGAARRSYRQAGAEESLVLSQDDSVAARWLLSK